MDMRKIKITMINKVKLSTYLPTLCLSLIVKELKISVEQGRVVTTLNITRKWY